jgi:hypothetical protein
LEALTLELGPRCDHLVQFCEGLLITLGFRMTPLLEMATTQIFLWGFPSSLFFIEFLLLSSVLTSGSLLLLFLIDLYSDAFLLTLFIILMTMNSMQYKLAAIDKNFLVVLLRVVLFQEKGLGIVIA